MFFGFPKSSFGEHKTTKIEAWACVESYARVHHTVRNILVATRPTPRGTCNYEMCGTYLKYPGVHFVTHLMYRS
jgi:hypothetical protein